MCECGAKDVTHGRVWFNLKNVADSLSIDTDKSILWKTGR